MPAMDGSPGSSRHRGDGDAIACSNGSGGASLAHHHHHDVYDVDDDSVDLLGQFEPLIGGLADSEWSALRQQQQQEPNLGGESGDDDMANDEETMASTGVAVAAAANHGNGSEEEEEEDDDDDVVVEEEEDDDDVVEEEDEEEHAGDEEGSDGGEGDDDDDDSVGGGGSSNCSSDEDGDDDDEDEETGGESTADGVAAAPKQIIKDGRVLSDYEIRRLERIRRNEEYLANLGLEGKGGGGNGGFLGRQSSNDKKRSRPKKKPINDKQKPAIRRPSRNASRNVDYSEPKVSVKSMLLEAKEPKHKGEGKPGQDTEPSEKKRKEQVDNQDAGAPPKKKKKKLADRLELPLYREYLGIQKRKSRILKHAQRDLRTAKREFKYWSRLAEKAEIRQMQREQKELQREEEAKRKAEREARLKEQREQLGGATIRKLLGEVNRRMPELQSAAERYDAELKEKADELERERNRLEAEYKMKTIDALDWFPRALEFNEKHLNKALLWRVPDDPPPPRRSRRCDAVAEKDAANEKKPSKEKQQQASATGSEMLYKWEELPLNYTMPPGLIEHKSSSLSESIRDVGGWVSPDFAKLIDRSWLDGESPARPFDLKTYAPQVGECVLYYPSGHKEFLRKFPDHLGEKTGNTLRVPLWERAVSTGESSISQRWSTEEWKAGVANGTANYPILCVVQRSLPEFPPDPFSKVVEKIQDGEIMKVVLKPTPKDAASLKKSRGTPLRLAVELRPLTPVMPPKNGDEAVGNSPLPPTFTCITFPTSESAQFIIPFSWAYSINHSLFAGETVTFRSDGEKGRVCGLAQQTGEKCSCRFEDNMEEIGIFLASFRRLSTSEFISEALANAPTGFPPRDAHAVINVVRRFCDNRCDLKQPEIDVTAMPNFDLLAFVRKTLPLWKGVSAVKDTFHRKVISLSPWDVLPASKDCLIDFEFVNPNNLSVVSKAIDDCLKSKIDCAIEAFAEENPEADDFYYDITDEVAPSYSCAVPVGMSIEKILRRLRSFSKQVDCYYITVEQVLADIALIIQNATLYNSPESEVVRTAAMVLGKLEDVVVRVAGSHYQKRLEVSKAEEERRHVGVVTTHPSSTVNGADADGENKPPPPASHSSVSNPIKHPFRGKLNEDWLQSCQTELMWMPQVGDKVLYSREKHATFVKSHSCSLKPYQCILPPSFQGGPSEHADDSSWVSGTIEWISASFPNDPSGEPDEVTPVCFQSKSPLLALNVRFGELRDSSSFLYWRPCILPCDQSSDDGSCSVCGLSLAASFLRRDEDRAGDAGRPSLPSASIDRLFSLLKRRCIRGETIELLDPKLNIANVKEGYVTPSTRQGLKTLASFDELLCRSSDAAHQLGTRGVSNAREWDPAISSSLVECGYLPQWVSSSVSASWEKLSAQNSVSPWPKLSLELILLRVRNGYYRSTHAIMNDCVEAYVSSIFLLLSDAASRRKSPVSVNRIARTLSSGDAEAAHVDLQLDTAVKDEESAWVARARRIRELYAMALLCVTEPLRMERLLGLCKHQHLPTEPAVDEDPVRSEARQMIRLLSAALQKDPRQNVFGSSKRTAASGRKKMKLNIVCGGRSVSKARYFRRQTYNVAVVNDKPVKVTAICGGKIISSLKDLDDAALSSKAQVADLNHQWHVKVVCNGKSLVSKTRPQPVASIPHVLGDSTIVREVANCITLKRSDYEENDGLARFLFGRPGKMNPCARCQAYKQSVYYCRVKKSHSNIDFDWIAAFKGRGGIDSILRAIHPQDVPTANIPESTENGAHEDEDDEENGDQDDQKDDTAQQEKDAKRISLAEKAKVALSLATAIFKGAQDYAKAPVRFSGAFIKENFPVDDDDGHYVYCVICGTSGNLLCCDGCPNVVHCHCAELPGIPEDDWFCEECVTARSGSSLDGKNAEAPQMDCTNNNLAAAHVDPISPSKALPFGRVEFNEDKLHELDGMLEDLYRERPEYNRMSSTRTDTNTDGGDESTSKPGLGAPHEHSASATNHHSARAESLSSQVKVPKAKKRGRPRKHPVQVTFSEAGITGEESDLDDESGTESKAISKKRRAKKKPPTQKQDDGFDDDILIKVANDDGAPVKGVLDVGGLQADDDDPWKSRGLFPSSSQFLGEENPVLKPMAVIVRGQQSIYEATASEASAVLSVEFSNYNPVKEKREGKRRRSRKPRPRPPGKRAARPP